MDPGRDRRGQDLKQLRSIVAAAADMGVRIVRSPVLLSAIAAGVAVVLLVWLNRGIWFFGDDFAMLVERRRWLDDGRWVDALFHPHNEHPAVPTALVYLSLQELVGMRHPILYALPMIAMHALVVFCIGLILSRHLLSRSWTIAGLVAVVFLAAGWENMLWTFQFGFIGAVAFGLVHLLILTSDIAPKRRDLLALATGVVAVLMQGHGFILVLLGGVILVRGRQWKSLAICTATPVAVFGLWYVTYGRTTDHDSSNWDQRLLLPRYLWRGLTESADGVLNLPGTAVIVLVAAAAVMIVRSELVSTASLPVLLATGAILFYALTGFGRVRFGIEQASASRYAYVGVALLVPIVFIALEHFAARSPHRHAVAVLLACWLAVAGVTELRDIATDRRHHDAQRLAVMSSAGQLVLQGAVSDPDLAPSPRFDKNISAGKIASFIERGWWPEGHVDERGLLRAATIVGLDLGSTSDATTLPGVHPAETSNLVAAPAGDCIAVTPFPGATVTLRPTEGSPIGIRAADDVTLNVALGSSSVRFRTIPREFPIDGETSYLLTGWLPGSRVILLLQPTTTYEICGVVTTD